MIRHRCFERQGTAPTMNHTPIETAGRHLIAREGAGVHSVDGMSGPGDGSLKAAWAAIQALASAITASRHHSPKPRSGRPALPTPTWAGSACADRSARERFYRILPAAHRSQGGCPVFAKCHFARRPPRAYYRNQRRLGWQRFANSRVGMNFETMTFESSKIGGIVVCD